MKYLVTPAPHKYSKANINDMYIYTTIALAMCFMYGVISYSWQALIILATCFGTCVVLELTISSIKNKKFCFQDLSCFVTGLSLACVMPINMPWYFGIIGAVIAVATKYLFGGLGNNLFNPSALGRSALGCLFAGFSFSFYGSTDTTLKLILDGNKSLINLEELLIGNSVGAVGTTCILMIVVCAIALMIFRIVRWENILFSLIGFVCTIWILLGAEYILPMIVSGSFIFVTVFMLGDPTTSPYGFSARSIYALIFGVLSAVMMSFNILGESAVFLALLIVNFIAPALDMVFSAFKKGVKNND